MQRLTMCVNQVCSKIFAKMHNLAKKIWKGWVKMGKCMCTFRSSPLEIEYFSENKVILLFFELFYVHIFLSILTLHSIFFIFSQLLSCII
jgi:hypothetical protein